MRMGILEGLNHPSIELGIGAPGQFLDSLSMSYRGAIGPGSGHGVVGIRHADDPGYFGNRLALDAVRKA